MHLVGPYLTTTGRKKSKRKYRTAAQAAQARELSASWQNLLDEHGVKKSKAGPKKPIETQARVPDYRNYRGSDQPRIPSLPFTGEVCAKPADKVYTGDKMIGIGTLHKSNAVPVFSSDDAKDIARMRR
jgi:hypothetical protein